MIKKHYKLGKNPITGKWELSCLRCGIQKTTDQYDHFYEAESALADVEFKNYCIESEDVVLIEKYDDNGLLVKTIIFEKQKKNIHNIHFYIQLDKKNDMWEVVHDKEVLGQFKTKKEALDFARPIAKEKEKIDVTVQIYEKGEDGKFSGENTYGPDPFPPKDLT
jgi:flagellar hook assembly protein FlgD